MGLFENPPSRSNDAAIDMPTIEISEEEISALKSQEVGKPWTHPCKELNTILEYEAQQVGCCLCHVSHVEALDIGWTQSHGHGGFELEKRERGYALILREQGIGTSSKAKARPPIQKVPGILRDNEKNKNSYNPRLVSIGPYHYGAPNLKLGQTLKARLVQHDLASHVKKISNGSKSLNAYFHSEYFGEVAREARNCYAEGSTDSFNEESFKCLMFIDGCFVVYFIHCIVNNKCEEVEMKIDHQAIIAMDLFLLENQLPYAVLQALVTEFMQLEVQKGGDGDDIENFINKVARSTKRQLKSGRMLSNETKQSTETTGEKERQPLHLLDFLRTKFIETGQTPFNKTNVPNWQSFRSVEELKAAGIFCKRSNSSCIKEINLKRRGRFKKAYLSLPVIVIDDSFKTKWLNLVAYEACPDFLNDGAITSFICFMDSLIDCPRDVKELRKKCVLLNCLGSDQQVAELFNELSTELTPNPYAYRDVKSDIENHFSRKLIVRFAEFRNTHFGRPWIGLASLVAVLVLGLTAIQAFFAIFPRN